MVQGNIVLLIYLVRRYDILEQVDMHIYEHDELGLGWGQVVTALFRANEGRKIMMHAAAACTSPDGNPMGKRKTFVSTK